VRDQRGALRRRLPPWLPPLASTDEQPTRVFLLVFWLAYAISFVVWLVDMWPSLADRRRAGAAAVHGAGVCALHAAVRRALRCCGAWRRFARRARRRTRYSLFTADSGAKPASWRRSRTLTRRAAQSVRDVHEVAPAALQALSRAAISACCAWTITASGSPTASARAITACFSCFWCLCVLLHNWFAVLCARLLWVRGEVRFAMPQSPQIWLLLVFHVLNGLWELTVLAVQIEGATKT
jgi:hypothetical protein